MAYDFGTDDSGFGSLEQPSGWDSSSTATALSNPSWQMPESGGSGGFSGWLSSLFGGGTGGDKSNSSWGGIGKDLLGGILPGLAGMGVGALANKLMPGTPAKLVDTRTPQQQGLAASGFSSLQELQKNPNSFGLPGDPEDVNTPAGRKLYGIRQQTRSADAARGMFNTGGSAQRENNAVTDAANSAFADLTKTYGNQAGVGGMQLTAPQENPWAKLITGFGAPAVAGGVGNVLQRYGFNTSNPYKVG